MKRLMKFVLIILLLVLFLTNCSQSSGLEDPELQKLASWRTGTFSSEKQADAYTNFFYFYKQISYRNFLDSRRIVRLQKILDEHLLLVKTVLLN